MNNVETKSSVAFNLYLQPNMVFLRLTIIAQSDTLSAKSDEH